MPPLSTAVYRTIIALAATTLCAALVIPNIGVVRFSADIEAARSWNYFGALLPLLAIYAWYAVWGLLTLAGLVGLFFFWKPARALLAGSLVLSLVAQPFLGLVVYSSMEATFAAIAGMLLLWLVTVSYWSSLAGRFMDRRENVP